jgi:hypothetical protein
MEHAASQSPNSLADVLAPPAENGLCREVGWPWLGYMEYEKQRNTRNGLIDCKKDVL